MVVCSSFSGRLKAKDAVTLIICKNIDAIVLYMLMVEALY